MERTMAAGTVTFEMRNGKEVGVHLSEHDLNDVLAVVQSGTRPWLQIQSDAARTRVVVVRADQIDAVVVNHD
jgi:hypothetical protein